MSKRRTHKRKSSGNTANNTRAIAILAASIVLAVLFFLSNAGLFSAVGSAMHGLMMGLFGVMGYVFPPALAAAAVLWFIFKDRVPTGLKLAAAALTFVFLCVIMQLARADYDAQTSFAEIYKLSVEHPAGGVFGGAFVKLISPHIGKAGCMIIFIILTLLGIFILIRGTILDMIMERLKAKIGDGRRQSAYRRNERRLAREEEDDIWEDDEYDMPPEPAERGRTFRGVTKDTLIGSPAFRNSSQSIQKPAAAKNYTDPLDDMPLEGHISGIDGGYRSGKSAAAAQKNSETEKKSETEQPQEPEEQKDDFEEVPIPEVRTEKLTPEFGPDSSLAGRKSREDSAILASSFRSTASELQKIDDLHSSKSPLPNPPAPENADTIYIDNESGAFVRHEEVDVEDESPDYYETSPVSEYKLTDMDKAVVSYGGEYGEEDEEELEDNKDLPEDWYDSQFQEEEYPEYPAEEYPEEEYFEEEYPEENYPEEEYSEEDYNEPLTVEDINKDVLNKDAQYLPASYESDIRRVETSNGKIIEADVDPDDPIAKRLREEHIDTVEAGSTYEDISTSNAVSALDPVNAPYKGEAVERSINGHNNPGTADNANKETELLKAINEAPKKKKRPFRPPYYNMLVHPKKSGPSNDNELKATAKRLEQTLKDFGVGVTVTNYSRGPAVTRYEIQPDHGVKVSKILSFTDDIKLNLAVADIRIEAPIPGKSAIGIEVPNKETVPVYLSEVIESDKFKNHKSKLAFAVGRDIAGEIIVGDLAKMPHLLIAGQTGSGKSVCINSLIVSLLYHSKPSEVGLIMIDPKIVELSVYQGIPHLMYPVVTDARKAAAALNWAVNEMTNRYKKFADANVRDLKGYNKKVDEESAAGNDMGPKMKQIVIIVDELADLMMVSAKEVEDAICRLAQMARAAGIHMVIATQRPSVNVITGLIKANIPSRIAFSVTSGVDSRTILDSNGAEKLLGHGDMLYFPAGLQKPLRVQGCFIDDPEVNKVAEFLKQMGSDIEDDEQIEIPDSPAEATADTSNGSSSNGIPDRDELYVQVGEFVTSCDKPISIGLLQRKFRIGFNRAARIMDDMADDGVVSPDEGKKSREALMTKEEFLAWVNGK